MTGIWNDLIVWVGFVLLAAVAAMMIFRRLYKEFPFLFAYFVVEIMSGIVLRALLLHGSALSLQYFYAYWLSEAFKVAASFAALYEVFLVRLFPLFHTTPVYRYLFPAVILLGCFLAGFVFLSAPHQGPNMLSVLVGETTLALTFLQVVLLVFFSMAVVVLGGGWEWHEFGIALGYGLYALSKLVSYAVRAKAKYAKTPVDQLPSIGYFVALVIWLIYLSREYKPPDVDIPMELVEKAEAWISLLLGDSGSSPPIVPATVSATIAHRVPPILKRPVLTTASTEATPKLPHLKPRLFYGIPFLWPA
jgi:hypothetical protein